MRLALHVSSQMINGHNAVSHKYCLGSTNTCMMSQAFPTSHVYMCKVCMMQNKQTTDILHSILYTRCNDNISSVFHRSKVIFRKAVSSSCYDWISNQTKMLSWLTGFNSFPICSRNTSYKTRYTSVVHLKIIHRVCTLSCFLFCFVLRLNTYSFYPYPSGLPHRRWINHVVCVSEASLHDMLEYITLNHFEPTI